MNTFEERGITHLDLHGVKHTDVESETINFIYQYQNLLPLIIICGNSSKMIDIVSKSLEAENIKYSSPRFGIIRVEGID
ncbi:hypothetical protein N9Y72_01660 [Gammaproteobacteria bacterium]|jgi:hypothetical protein|nr:hypothetical protein [Gammaproteobacteria bacterium]